MQTTPNIVADCTLLVIDVDYSIRSLNTLSEHWGSRQTRRARERRVIAKALEGRKLPPLPVRVTFTRLAFRYLDSDNLAIAFKTIRDGLADVYGVGDSPRDPIDWAYSQEVRRVRGRDGRWRSWFRVEVRHVG